MKKIQQGFTLIELMIVVAIIGILAAVAIPAYQDYIVKAKLSKVVSTLDPVKTALALYYQEQGSFPTAVAADAITTANQGVATVQGEFWNSLGFSVKPSLPPEVSQMAVHMASQSNIALILTMANVKATTIDGKFISLSPIAGTKPTSATTTNLAATQTIAGASAIGWNWGCQAGSNLDAVAKNFFKNGNQPLTGC